MNRQEREAFERAVIEVLDGAADGRSTEAFRREAEASPEHRAVFARLEAAWEALQAAAAAERAEPAGVDLRDAVLSAIAAGELPPDRPELEAPSADSIAMSARELFLDPPDEAAHEAVSSFRGCSGAHREEADAYGALADALRAHEHAATPSYPAVDLRGAVLATLDGGEKESKPPRTPRSSVVSFQRGRLHRAQSVQWPVVAAAAVLLMMIGGWSLFAPRDVEAPSEPVAVAPAPVQPEPPVQIAAPTEEPATPEATPLEDAFHRMAEAMPQPLQKTPAPEALAAHELETITPGDIWDARQHALAAPEARGAVRALARVPMDRARELAEQPGQRAEVMAGLARSLPPVEARAALMAIREDREPTPSLVFAQGEATQAAYLMAPDEAAPEGAPDLNALIAELRAIDPYNALTYYWEAVERLQRGDLDGALALLEAAEQLETAQAYSLDGARSAQSALEAAGMSRDSAAAAAALSAGMDQYDFITALGQDLLDEAFRYEALGHSEAAEQILNAAQRFGAQIEAGGEMSWEQLAGLDLQRAAIEALEAFLMVPDDLMALTNDALNLVAGMESMASFFEAMNSLFSQPFEADFFSELSQLILTQGDLQLFSYP